NARHLCYDQEPDAHRGQTTYFTSTTAGPTGNTACPAGRRWDFNADGTESRRYTAALNRCFWEPAGCSRGGDTDTSGWHTSGAVPACGTFGLWATNCAQRGLTSCSFNPLAVRH